MTVWVTDWRTDWLTEWLTDKLTEWLIDWLAGWQSDSLTVTGWLTDWLTNQLMINWLINWSIAWLIDWLIELIWSFNALLVVVSKVSESSIKLALNLYYVQRREKMITKILQRWWSCFFWSHRQDVITINSNMISNSLSVPGPPSNLQIYPFGEYLLVTWTPPKEPNGIITNYQVGSAEYSSSSPESVVVTMETIDPNVFKKLLGNRRFETSYVVELRAKTSKGWGASLRTTTKTIEKSGEKC